MADHQAHSRDIFPQQRPTPGSRTAESPAGAVAAGPGGEAQHGGPHGGPATPPAEWRSAAAAGYETGESSSSAARRREPDYFEGTRLDHLEDDDDDDDDGNNHHENGDGPHRLGIGSGEIIQQTRHDDQHHDHHHHQQQHHADGLAAKEDRAQRKHRSKMSGGFLLRNPLAGGRSLGFRRPRGSQLSGSTATPSAGGFEESPRTSSGSSDQAFRRSSGPVHSSISEDYTISTGTSSSRRFSDSHPSQEQPSLDADSSQIVRMALNLSDARRMAARRNTSRTNPPRLAPVPDAPSASNLKQHLQSQRKTSRGLEALPEASSGRPAAPLVNDSFQPVFELGNDLQYDFYLSPSTLARAQKAKEHLELLAQYRRLLEVLPPLKPGVERPTSSSPRESPVGLPRRSSFGAQAPPVMLGRQYNPLQYVRNRKVRARERQTIDGERQGFGDVTDVRSWVDSVSSQMSLAGTSLLQGRVSIPTFPGAEEVYNQDSAMSLARTASAPRGRRPRADWFVEPCDMIADAYWLEKDRHKDLIEDRHWRKIFPAPLAELNHAISLSGEEDSLGRPSLLLPRSAEHHENGLEEGESGLTKIRTDVAHNSAKERAKQKLQHFRDGLHHRHSTSVHAHDLLRLKKGSSSDLSDSDEDAGNHEGKKRSRPSRKGTISSNSNDLLQKQMLEMLAREAMENELEEVPESPEIGLPTSSDRQSFLKASGRSESRRGSLGDYSDSEPKYALGKSLSDSSARRGQDVNHLSTSSAGHQSSNANSPEPRPAKPLIVEPASRPEPLPPLSRSASPVRKPLDKIKRILRDKSNELIESHTERAEDEGDSRIPRSRSQSGAGLGKQPKRQPSPNGKFLSPNVDVTKSQRNNSKRPKADESVGLRGMFKGPRIDTVIRDSVFRLGDKLGDKIWKRDATTESPDLDALSDSDNDKAKRASPLTLSRRASGKIQHGRAYMKKHFLDSMPQFQHASESHRPAPVRSNDLPKTPGSDDCNEATAPYLPTTCKPCSGVSDVSEAESSQGALEAARSAGKCPKPTLTTTRLSCPNGRPLFRHWSPTDRGAPKSLVLSRREVARMRTLMLSSGIKAMEIHRRALEQHRPFSKANLAANPGTVKQEPGGLPWSEILELGPKHPELLKRQVPLHQAYPFAAQALNVAIQSWGHKWQVAAGRFTSVTSVELGNRAWDIRTLLVEDLSEMTRKAADEADETSRDLALGQPLKIKHVVDTIERMLRKRRRRFRWIRRGMWLTVEWLLVGLMWYVWFMVMILRIFLGVGRGVFGCVKWLLWL